MPERRGVPEVRLLARAPAARARPARARQRRVPGPAPTGRELQTGGADQAEGGADRDHLVLADRDLEQSSRDR